MVDRTKPLTNLDPRIKNFQHTLIQQYAQANMTVKPGQIVFVGSSLMEIFPIETMQQQNDYGLDKVIYNRGVRATTTADLLAHIDTLILDLKPSKVFINIGSNDIGFHVTQSEFTANYDAILSKIAKTLPQTEVFVMAYYPVNTVESFSEGQSEHGSLFAHRTNTTMREASDIAEQLAKKHGYTFIDVNDGLTDNNGNLRKELTFDGAHMLPAGYEIVLHNMLPYLH